MDLRYLYEDSTGGGGDYEETQISVDLPLPEDRCAMEIDADPDPREIELPDGRRIVPRIRLRMQFGPYSSVMMAHAAKTLDDGGFCYLGHVLTDAQALRVAVALVRFVGYGNIAKVLEMAASEREAGER